jgi:prepilin-type N-terminal cleavage/methylation domain-containing protein
VTGAFVLDFLAARDKSDETGFTLIELMIVVVIIGVLTSFALPNFAKMMHHAKVGRTASEMKSLSQAFVAYYAFAEQYPPDSHLTLPPGMDEYIKPSLWSDETPIGGHCNWDGPDSYPYAGLSIFPPEDISQSDRDMLDEMLDDGDLSQGRFRIGTSGRPTFIIEE